MKKSQRQSKARVSLHLVWATYERIPLLTPDIERDEEYIPNPDTN